MGASITKPATIVVKVDPDQQGVIHGGEVLKGMVYLDVRAATVECSSLQLLVAGAEHTCVHYTTHSGSG